MERVTLLLVLVGFLSPWGSLKVQGQPKFSLLTDGFDFDRILGEMKNSFKFPTALGSDTFPLDFADSFPKLPEFNFPPLFQSSPSLTKPPGSPWTFIPPQGGVSSTHAALVGPGSISGSSGPGGSFVTGTGNWYAVPGGKPGSSVAFFPPQGGVSSSQSVLVGPGSISGSSGPGGSFVTGTGNWHAVPGGKPGSSVAFFPPQGGVSSSQSVLMGPGSISGSSGPGGSIVTGTGNWSAVPGGKPGTSVAFFPPQGGVSSTHAVLVGPGSISGSSGPGGSFVNGTGNWTAYPSKPGSTGVKNVTTTPGPDSIKSLKMVPDIALVPTVGIVPKSDDVFEPPSYPMDYQQMPSLEALYYHYFLNYLYNPWMHYNPYYGVYGM